MDVSPLVVLVSVAKNPSIGGRVKPILSVCKNKKIYSVPKPVTFHQRSVYIYSQLKQYRDTFKSTDSEETKLAIPLTES